jgi:hypothetical protein
MKAITSPRKISSETRRVAPDGLLPSIVLDDPKFCTLVVTRRILALIRASGGMHPERRSNINSEN